MKLPEWFSLSASQLRAEASETDQRETKSLGPSLPLSLRRSHPQMSHIYMSDPRALKPLSYKDVDAL